MRKLILKLQEKLIKTYKEPKIKSYLINIYYLFIISLESVLIYYTFKYRFTEKEVFTMTFIIFILLIGLYSLISPTLWFWLIKKIKRKK